MAIFQRVSISGSHICKMIYLVKVTNHEWGTREKEYRIEAGNPGTASARAYRLAKQEKILGKRRLTEWIIKIKRIQ